MVCWTHGSRRGAGLIKSLGVVSGPGALEGSGADRVALAGGLTAGVSVGRARGPGDTWRRATVHVSLALRMGAPTRRLALSLGKIPMTWARRSISPAAERDLCPCLGSPSGRRRPKEAGQRPGPSVRLLGSAVPAGARCRSGSSARAAVRAGLPEAATRPMGRSRHERAEPHLGPARRRRCPLSLRPGLGCPGEDHLQHRCHRSTPPGRGRGQGVPDPANAGAVVGGADDPPW